MNTRQQRHVVGTLCIVSFLALLFAGCTHDWEFPIAPVNYPQDNKINLKVELRLSKELRNAKWERTIGDTYIIRLGKVLSDNAEMLVRNLFSDVCVTDAIQPPEAEVDAIITPRMVSAERTRPMLIFQQQRTTIMIEWTVKDANGNLIWADTITGEGKSPMGLNEKKNTGKQVKAAVKELFQNSFQAISQSPEIRKFAATH